LPSKGRFLKAAKFGVLATLCVLADSKGGTFVWRSYVTLKGIIFMASAVFF